MLFFVFLGALIIFISFKFNLLDRIASYFTVFSIVLIPNSINNMRLKHTRILMIVLVVIGFFMNQFIKQIYRPEWNKIYPIELILFD